MYLVSVTTPNYLSKASVYLSGLPLVRSCDVRVILLDFTDETDPDAKLEQQLRSGLKWIDFRTLPLPTSHSNFMIQHGCFLDALPEVGDDDLICLADMDIAIQRDFTRSEREFLALTGTNDVCAYWNAGKSDNLQLEANRIHLTNEWMVANHLTHAFDKYGCVNCGVLVARAGLFRKLRVVYESVCESFYAACPHRSRCQFLINWCFAKMGANVRIMPPTIHQHAHFRDASNNPIVCEEGVEFRMETLCVGGEPVLFRHAF